MKRFVAKLCMAAVLFGLTCGSVFAASAKVTYVKGKVEVSRGNAWVAVKVGDEIKESETISTGFQSEARLNYNGSVMAVPALSRITLETLQSSGTKETVSLKVDTGAVRSKVTHAEGKRIEYTARTPVGVASVRGTDFTVFANGKAIVTEGAIVYYDAASYTPAAASGDSEGGEEEGGEEEGGDEAVTDAGAGADANAAGGDDAGSAGTSDTKDQGPAKSTTPAEEIAISAPKGATVVGAGQTATVNKAGEVSNPFDEAKTRNTKAKTVVSTAADKDSAASGAGAATSGATTTPVEEKGSIVVTFEIPKTE